MKLKMTRTELFGLNSEFNQLSSVTGISLIYKLSKNHNLIKSVVKQESLLLNKIKSQKADKEIEYQQKRNDLYLKHAKRDDKGNPVFINNTITIANMDAFKLEEDAIKEEFKTTIEQIDARAKESQDFMSKDIEFEVHEIAKTDITDTRITKAQMDVISKFIIENNSNVTND